MDGRQVSFAVMDFSFIGGSMGSVVGEKISRTIERAIDRLIPLVIVSCSGGARMQEGILSLSADGEDFGVAGATGGDESALYFDSDESDDGRRDGQLCIAG